MSKVYLMICFSMGGIVPVIAKRWHENAIEEVVNTALENAHLTVQDVDAVAVTVKPGLLINLYTFNENTDYAEVIFVYEFIF